MGKKKKFIDKKNAVTFRLVHRSQRDPLIADENAPQHVLQQIKDERKDELEKYGIYYDDDYDYLQHLKERATVAEMIEVPSIIIEKEKKPSKKLAFPSSVFQSELEEKEGMLNKAAPKSGLQLDLDPDIVAAMDEDFDYSDPENVLDDDFVLQANANCDGNDEENDEENGDDYEEMIFGSDNDDEFDEEETKSRFTQYSMTSSVIRRNEQLTMLDGRFEEMYTQYDENEIGALDCEEIEGDIDTQNEMLEKIMKQYESTRIVEPLETHRTTLIPSDATSSDSDSGSSVIEIKEKEKWDCESILSTNSTLYNHPKLIDAPPSNRIRISGKTGIPITKEKLTASTLAKFDESTNEETGGIKNRATGPGSLASAVSYLSIRPKGETADDRLARKRAFRQHKRERRNERKLNTEAFKEEKKRMEKMVANNKCKFHVPI